MKHCCLAWEKHEKTTARRWLGWHYSWGDGPHAGTEGCGNTQPRSQTLALECAFWGQWVLTEQLPRQIILQELIAWENLSHAGGWSAVPPKLEVSSSLCSGGHKHCLERRQAVLSCSSSPWLMHSTDIFSGAKCFRVLTFLACVTESVLAKTQVLFCKSFTLLTKDYFGVCISSTS